MSPAGVNPYLKTKVLTASPQELRLMLFDGVLKFCRQGRAALDEGTFDRSYDNLIRAQKIVLELNTSLKTDLLPEVTSRLAALYTYIYRLLIEANIERQLKPLDEAIGLLEYERETWALLMERGDQDAAAERDAASIPTPEAVAPSPPSATNAPTPDPAATPNIAPARPNPGLRSAISAYRKSA
ncbi:MAG: flagellar export chaperone FliS [Planctomycetota bacterium]